MAPQQHSPGTGAASKSALPFVLGAGLAFGLVRLVLRKHRDDSPAPPAAADGRRHRHHRSGGE